MLTKLRNRGVADVCIVCCDGLTDAPATIRAIWPDSTVQTCVVRFGRNTLRYVANKQWKDVTADNVFAMTYGDRLGLG